MCYADDTTIYAIIPRPLSRPQVMELLNQDLAASNFWCLKWHMRLNPKKTKSMVVSRSRTSAPGYDDLTLGGAELEKVKSLRILGVVFDSILTFEIPLREAVSKAARNLGVVCRASMLFDCPRVLNGCFYAYVLSSLEYCASLWMLSAEAHLCLLDSIIRSAESCVRMSFFLWGTEERLVTCASSIRFFIERTTQ